MPPFDAFLPTAPARVRVLVLPAGPIHRDRFAAYFDRLRNEYAVHLCDVSADSRPNRNMFNPLAFPDGVLFYDLTTSVPQPSHLALSPFDLFREPLVVLALADGEAIKTVPFGDALKRHSAASAGRSVEERNIRALDQELEALRDTYPRALVHRILVFDYAGQQNSDNGSPPIPIPEGLATVPPLAQSKRTTMKTVMADITSLLLAEMTTLARSFEALPFIESPGQSSPEPGDAAATSTAARRNSHFALPTHRSSSAGGVDRSHARMSMPVPFKGAASAFGSGGGGPTQRRPSTPVRSGTASTFDDIVGGGGGNTTLSSPERTGSPLDASSRASVSTAATTGDSHRSQSQDRIAVQGFGAGGLNERWRHKGKCRVGIVVASLYLQAGRWTDALKELVDGATVARSINDHLWHGKALELIVLCLLLLGWADIEFQVPTVCLPPPEKGSAAALLAAAQLEAAAAAAAASATSDASARAADAQPTQPRWLRHLQQILPDLLERILGLYTRLSAERLPPLALAETTIRFGNLLAALHIADGVLGRRMLDMVVEGKYAAAGTSLRPALSSSAPSLPFAPRLSVVPSRTHVTNLLFRAFPSSATEMLTTADRVVLLGGIATVLGRLGSRRKKAMVVRELISVLVGGLVEARTRGAAEVGIHPAAGLVAQTAGGGGSSSSSSSSSALPNGAAMLDLAEDDIEAGLDAFLGMLLRTYGVVEYDPAAAARTRAGDGHSDADRDADAAVVARIRAQAAARMYGMPGAKLSLLRACIHFSEALPDFMGVLRYSSDLLRTAGSGIAPGGQRGDAAPSIGRDEQVQLVTNIAKTSDLAQRLGFGGSVAAEYWDEFLLRGVKLEAPPEAYQPVVHAKSELLPGLGGYGSRGALGVAASSAAGVRTSQDVDPFIHNSFLKASGAAVVEQILVAEEAATFKLTLQNPYDIEVEIESIRLETTMEPAAGAGGDGDGGRSADADGGGGAFEAFEAFAESAVLGPYRTQIVKVAGRARTAGALHITGAIVRVRGCRERRFPLFVQPWWPERDEKVKRIGVAPFEVEAAAAALTPAGPPLQPERVALTVIPPQPLVVVRASTLAQSAVMLLEGERRVFSVTLANLSATTAVDFLVFSFRDSTQASVQAALANRDASPTELYEYELMLARKQALRLRKTTTTTTKGDAKQNESDKFRRYIGPGETATFEFEILGKPGLTSGTIQVDYAHLGVPLEAVGAKFYTRQVSLYLTVTVNASVEVARMDVLPLDGPIPAALWDRCGGQPDGQDDGPGDGQAGGTTAEDDQYCLLQLDLRNAWPSQMRVALTGADGRVAVRARILPGNTRRVLVPLRRMYVEDAHAAIPVLNPARQRQFVVSTGKISPDMERATREAFWYREAVLGVLQGTWATEGDEADGGDDVGGGGGDKGGGGGDDDDSDGAGPGRHGRIELRGMRLTARMIEALKVDEVGIDVAVEAAAAPGKAVAVVAVDTPVQVRVRITNRTAQPLYPTLRLLPALCHRPVAVALDYTRKFGWNGTLQQALPELGARATAEVRLGAVALCRGEFEVKASVEETRLWEATAEQQAEEQRRRQRGRPRSNTETLLQDTMLGPRERRIWHSRQACRFLVVDG